MKILMFNPNTSKEVTEKMKIEAQKYENENLIIDVKMASMGPEGIENSYDQVIAAYVVVEEFKKLEDEYDAFVIGCFADPGLEAAKSILKVPVIGMFEAAIYEASLRGSKFSTLGTGDSNEIAAVIKSAREYGLSDRLASANCLGIGVAGVTEDTKDVVKEEIQKYVSEDGAGTIILTCAAFSGYGSVLTKELGINVIDGIKTSIYFAKMMVELNEN